MREFKDTYTVCSFDDVLEKHRAHESKILIVSLSGNECQEGSSGLIIKLQTVKLFSCYKES